MAAAFLRSRLGQLISVLCIAATMPMDADAQATKPAQVQAPQVSMKTSMGEIVIELYPDKAPKSVENFLGYVKEGFYSGTVFHRVISNFMIQGGGMTRDLKRKNTRGPIAIESQNGLKNEVGAVSMARTGEPDSATSQFFINTVANASLDFPAPDGYGYTVFGKVIKGMDIVNKIRAVPTMSTGQLRDVPVDPIVIDSVTLIGVK